jgi:hypothetical protein
MERHLEEEILVRLARMEEHLKSRAELCDVHKSELLDLKKDVRGNGRPGVIRELEALKTEFIRFEAKVLAYATIGAGIGGILIDVFRKKVGW